MTAACADEAILCDDKMVKSSASSNLTAIDAEKVERNHNKKINRVNIHLDDEVKNDVTIMKTESCSRQLEIYLESRGIVHTWDDHEYTCIGEVASAASSSSLESHELISDANSSSGYNSSGVDCTIKCKRDSDSLSASSRSDCGGELNCPTATQLNQIERNNLNSNTLKINLYELERSMDEIRRIKSQYVESENSIRATVNRNDVVEEKGTEAVDETEEIYEQDERMNFHEAVRMGDAECVAKIVAGGFIQDLDEPDWNVSGDPPLLVAATNHSLPVLGVLLSNGCNPGVRSPRGETALHRAILNGGPGNVLKFVHELLKYGCSPGVKEAGGGLTALHILARQLSHAQSSRSQHNHHYDLNEALETLSVLAKAGAVNDKDHQGRSALHILASSTIFENNHKSEIESIVKILLDAGADPTLTNDRGETALHESLECGALSTAFLLMPHTPIGIVSRYGETPLHVAARKNYIDIVGKLLSNGENPSIQDVGGNTPLHLASARGFHQIVSQIVTSPLVQLEKLNDDGLTALQVAAESGFVMAVRLLLKAGADPSLMANCATLHHRHPDIFTIIDHELTKRRQLAT
ncbi:hypothetical protein PV328_002008 [Microctonus aethiopoides]|uniref:Ankyrin-2 n=1 Tax=Microctonus aethiopoides TaxID=144406 RepID=A0AA39FYE5_9HYME|nr:hypothetical protein PV328_002008 [Microctonus aethiopoides]